MRQLKGILPSVLTELVITSCPIFALLYAFGMSGKIQNVFNHEEWLFAAAILFAQSIIKLMHILSSKCNFHKEWIIFTAVIIGVVGLLPSTMLLAKKLGSDGIGTWSIWIYPIIFFFSFLTFAWSAGFSIYANMGTSP